MGENKNIGFIGLGLMGNPMAKNILKNGFPLVVYNRTTKKTEELNKLGASVATTPKELASLSDIVITMVTAPDDVEEVLFGENGVIHANHLPEVVIDMSTIGSESAKKIASKLNEFGIKFVDAPVTGSTPKAITGELTIFVGADDETLHNVKKVLEAMGSTILHMGSIGSGQAVKLLNNYLIASSNQALIECMLLADKMGLSREKAADALSKTPNISPSQSIRLDNYVHETFPLLFTLSNLRKDLGLAVKEMRGASISLPELSVVEDTFNKANMNTELSQKDFTAILLYLKESLKTDI